MQNLDGGAAVDERILDQVHLSKAALSEQPNHAVISKELADFHCHFCAGQDVTPVRVGDKIISGPIGALSHTGLVKFELAITLQKPAVPTNLGRACRACVGGGKISWVGLCLTASTHQTHEESLSFGWRSGATMEWRLVRMNPRPWIGKRARWRQSRCLLPVVPAQRHLMSVGAVPSIKTSSMTNQASRASSTVPVLPAAGRLSLGVATPRSLGVAAAVNRVTTP